MSGPRNAVMVDRIVRMPVAYAFRFMMSGGGGGGLCSHFRGVCTEGSGHPEDRWEPGPRGVQAFDHSGTRGSA